MNPRTATAALLELIVIFAATVHVAGAVADPTVDATKLIDAAVAHVVSVGREAAARDFVTDSRWIKGTTYIVFNDFQGTVLAHSANPKMVGKVMFEAKDASGKFFVRECVHNIKTKGESLIDVKWGNPLTKKIAPAQMLSKRIPGQDLYISVLIFK